MQAAVTNTFAPIRISGIGSQATRSTRLPSITRVGRLTNVRRIAAQQDQQKQVIAMITAVPAHFASAVPLRNDVSVGRSALRSLRSCDILHALRCCARNDNYLGCSAIAQSHMHEQLVYVVVVAAAAGQGRRRFV